MKVVDIKTYALSTKLADPFYFGEGWIRGRNSMIVEVVTDEGIVGWGEGFCHGNQPPELAQAVVENVLKDLVVGADPWDVEVLWEKMYYDTQPYGRKGVVISAISAIDVALWDCLGRATERPIHKLLGGAYRKDVKAYASGFFRRPGSSYPRCDCDEALGYIEQGYSGMKLKGGFGVKHDLETMRCVRESVGDDILLMVDANCAYNVAATRRLLRGYEELDVHWLEEPLPPNDLEGYLELKNLTSVYIAACENEFTKQGYREWVARRAVDILQPDLCFAGGFSECRKILALAQAWNVTVMPHAWGSGIGLAASMQFAATVPDAPSTFMPEEPLMEYDRSDHPFRQELTYPNILMKDGRIPIPDAPGIGVEVNRDALNHYAKK